MPLTNEELLQKASFTTADFGGAGEAPLSIEQADRFIVLLAADQVVLPDVRRVTSRSAKWNESILDFSGRILRPGTEFTRLGDADRVKPGTGQIEIDTTLFRGEVPVSDEAMEDAAARANFQGDLLQGMASRIGFDIEDLMINGDTAHASGEAYLQSYDGWVKQARTAAGANVYDASGDGQDYQAIFRRLISAVPERHKRNLVTDGRFYVPKRLEEMYREALAARGTALGDAVLQGTRPLTYQGIRIVGVPAMEVTAGTPDTTHILLTNRNNLYAGFRREVTFETFRDPREGGTSFIVTTRTDAKVAIAESCSVATNVDVES